MDHLSFKLLTLITILGLLLPACGPASAGEAAKSSERRETKPMPPEADLRALVDGNNAFALDLYQALRSRDGNLVYSPFGISLALAMTYAGARGETETQMADALHFDLPQNRLHPAFNALDLALENTPPGADTDQQPLQLEIANAVWAEQTFPFLKEFLDVIARNYGAGINLADFINNFEQTRKEINAWVSDKTNNRIKDLIPEGALNPNTRMALVNAIYFKADWLNPFKADSTRDAPFHLLDGSTMNVPMMNEGMFIPYAKGDGYQAVELAYAGNTAAMDILVPDQGNFADFESSLNIQKLEEIFNGMQGASVELSLPKFSFSADFSLPAELKKLGMNDAFDRSQADFSGMTGGRELFISDVIHKAFVAVDEKGTEAAAATAVIMEATGAMMYDVQLTIDRPFIFIIRDLNTGQILFIGRVLNPAD